MKYNLQMAIWVVVANMIGTGIFSSLGYQLLEIHDLFSIVILWAAGGIISLCGAYAYSRLAVHMPDAVGEYHYLSRLVHPSVGFLSSWISITVGFAAPIALVLKTMCAYMPAHILGLSGEVWALVALAGITAVHMKSYSASEGFHTAITLFKIAFLILFVAAGLSVSSGQRISFAPTGYSLDTITSSAFATSLVYVLYTYSGWNASTYLARELPHPERTLPVSMITGTLLVAVLYIGLNMMFLYAAPIHELVVDVKTFEPTDLAVVVAGHILPSNLVFVMQGIVCLLLLSSMSSMILAGPRITAAIAEQYSVLQLLAKRSSKGIPLYAIGLQTIIAVILFVSNSFEDTLKFTAMMLTLSSMATVGSILRIERKMLTMIASIVFLAANTWVVIHVSQDNPTSIVWTAVIIFLGIVLYAMLSLSRNRS